MTRKPALARLPSDLKLPDRRDIYYGGRWNSPKSGIYTDVRSPGTGESLGKVAHGSASDVDEAVRAAALAFETWRSIKPLERAAILRQIAVILRANARELAMIDSASTGNPVREMMSDANVAAMGMEFYAGLVTEMKGSSIPMGPDMVSFSVREPFGVVGRIIPFNHPLMFCAYRAAAPLAAGNTLVVKPPDQAPLSSLHFAELIDGLLPPGVFNVVPGDHTTGEALARHPEVRKIALIGSVPAGRAVMKAAADTIKPVVLELGGKNALIAFADANPESVAGGMVAGMNFTWCGQSCGSTSRAFVHASIYDRVLEDLKRRCEELKPGNPTEMTTDMGAIVSQIQFDRIMAYIDSAKNEGARLLCGGTRPNDPALANGHYILPTVFVDVEPHMTIAREEIFGPVLSVFKWEDERRMIRDVNALEYGLTCSIWTKDLVRAHQTARDVQAGYVWVNAVSRHYLGASFGGFKQSGIGREEGIEELFAYSQEKSIHIALAS